MHRTATLLRNGLCVELFPDHAGAPAWLEQHRHRDRFRHHYFLARHRRGLGGNGPASSGGRENSRSRAAPCSRWVISSPPLALEYDSLILFYLGYGVIGGAGIGFGYVTPVATVAKWFPDRKGLATGIVVDGIRRRRFSVQPIAGAVPGRANGGGSAADLHVAGNHFRGHPGSVQSVHQRPAEEFRPAAAAGRRPRPNP